MVYMSVYFKDLYYVYRKEILESILKTYGIGVQWRGGDYTFYQDYEIDDEDYSHY